MVQPSKSFPVSLQCSSITTFVITVARTAQPSINLIDSSFFSSISFAIPAKENAISATALKINFLLTNFYSFFGVRESSIS